MTPIGALSHRVRKKRDQGGKPPAAAAQAAATAHQVQSSPPDEAWFWIFAIFDSRQLTVQREEGNLFDQAHAALLRAKAIRGRLPEGGSLGSWILDLNRHLASYSYVCSFVNVRRPLFRSRTFSPSSSDVGSRVGESRERETLPRQRNRSRSSEKKETFSTTCFSSFNKLSIVIINNPEAHFLLEFKTHYCPPCLYLPRLPPLAAPLFAP